MLFRSNALSEHALMAAYTAANAAEKTKILLRFDHNTTINGAGLGLLIQLLSECRKKGQTVAITGISENFAHIFEMVGITQLAAVVADEREAKACLKAE